MAERCVADDLSFYFLSTTMNDVSYRDIPLFLSRCAVVHLAVMFSLFGFSESGLGENHLAVPVNLLSISLTDLGCERRVQIQKLSQSTERKAAVATTESMAVYQQQVSPTCHQVTV